MFASEPFATVYVVPYIQTHLSAFSCCMSSNHAFKSGSVATSSSSRATTDAIASAPGLSFGLVLVCVSHKLGHWTSGLPTNAYLRSSCPYCMWLCQPQYALQKPDDSCTSADDSTK